jgi:hypothetical protein
LLALGLVALWFSTGTPSRADVCGSFELVPSPTAAGQTSLLAAAEAITTDDVWTVGTAVDGFRGLALHWNGTSWNETDVPNPDRENDLRGVAAFSPSDVWSVGGQNPPAGSVRALVIHWDGDNWSEDSGPSGLDAGAFLWSTRTIESDLWAVGTKVVGAPGPLGGTLAARRRGGSWEVFSTPNIADRTNEFLAVDGATPDDVWAVGDGRSVGGPYRILLAHWDGSTWSNVDVPSPGANDFLRGVAAVSSNDVWAAGEWYDLTEGTQPLLLHWDGLSWTQYPLPVFPEGAANLEDIFAGSVDDIWAVGTHATNAGVPRPLILHWDGVKWEQTPGAPDLEYEWFRGVTGAGSCDVWAVGQYFDGAQTATLTEHLLAQIADVRTDELSDTRELRIAPNPASESAVVSFTLAARTDLEVFVVDAGGRLLRHLATGPREPGPVAIFWDGRDAGGSRVAPGIYFLRVGTGREARSGKLVVR